MLISGHRAGGPFCTHTESEQNREPGPHLVPQSFPRTPADTWEGNAGEHKIGHVGKPQNEHKNHTCDCLKVTIANSNSQLMFREAPSLRMVPVLGLKDAKTDKQTTLIKTRGPGTPVTATQKLERVCPRVRRELTQRRLTRLTPCTCPRWFVLPPLP